jgi:hypothetical protein
MRQQEFQPPEPKKYQFRRAVAGAVAVALLHIKALQLPLRASKDAAAQNSSERSHFIIP